MLLPRAPGPNRGRHSQEATCDSPVRLRQGQEDLSAPLPPLTMRLLDARTAAVEGLLGDQPVVNSRGRVTLLIRRVLVDLKFLRDERQGSLHSRPLARRRAALVRRLEVSHDRLDRRIL